MEISVDSPIKIILADQHKSFIEGLASYIRASHPDIAVEALLSSGADFWQTAEWQSSDVLVIEPHFAGCQPIDFISRLKRNGCAKILVLTGESSSDFRETLFFSGVHGVVLKDESIETIIKAVKKVNSGELWGSKILLGKVFDKLLHPRRLSEADPNQLKIATLTGREKQIIVTLLSLESSTNEEIAAHLFISQSTLKNHLTVIYSKLEVRNRVDLMKFALKHKLAEDILV